MRERIRKLRELIADLNDAGVRRTTFFHLVAESLRQTEGQPRPLRRAQAFAHLLDHAELVVLPHELLAGSILGLWPLATGLPRYEERRWQAVEAIERFLADPRRRSRAAGHGSSMMLRDHYDANIPYADLQRLIREMSDRYAHTSDIGPREIGLVLQEHFEFNYGQETRRLFRELPWVVANHLDLNYGKVVSVGLSGIHDDILDRLGRAERAETRAFYESTRIAVEAALRFARRYADELLRHRGHPDVTPARADELTAMAAVCRKVASQPPETFREALQLLWLVHTMANVGGGSALSFARFDQYMLPFYRRDVARGALTRDDAKELLSCLWLKVNEPHMRTVQSLCLAGTTPDGQRGANELTSLCLEVTRDAAQPYPNVAVRVGRDTPQWLWEEIAETIQAGIGHPSLLNDDTWVPNRVRLGYPLEAARDYYHMGCVEIMTQGCMGRWLGVGAVDMPRLVEHVLRNGEPDLTGDRGIQTGALESFETFEQFFDAFAAQVRHRVGVLHDASVRSDEHVRGQHYDPFGSALIGDCLERGRDMFQGGSRYPPIRPISGRGLATGADSLLAVKKLVFEQGRYTLPELWHILQDDYRGHEALRKELATSMPCYGTDDAEADALARRVLAVYADAVHAHNRGDGPGFFATTMFTYTQHVNLGDMTAATPNGRRRGDTISNGVDPTPGRDTRGPTALINSVTAAGHSNITAACAFNLKLSPAHVRGEAGKAVLRGLLKSYVQRGGAQIQVNFVDQQTLVDAMEHPERHRNLIVRVGGYSEYFNNLDRRLQAEIVRRTAHGLEH